MVWRWIAARIGTVFRKDHFGLSWTIVIIEHHDTTRLRSNYRLFRRRARTGRFCQVRRWNSRTLLSSRQKSLKLRHFSQQTSAPLRSVCWRQVPPCSISGLSLKLRVPDWPRKLESRPQLKRAGDKLGKGSRNSVPSSEHSKRHFLFSLMRKWLFRPTSRLSFLFSPSLSFSFTIHARPHFISFPLFFLPLSLSYPGSAILYKPILQTLRDFAFISGQSG